VGKVGKVGEAGEDAKAGEEGKEGMVPSEGSGERDVRATVPDREGAHAEAAYVERRIVRRQLRG
jgi:hypothetical protein